MTLVPLLSDVLLLLATLALAAYCWRLAQRLKAFNDVDSGLGGSIATLSLQVDELKNTLEKAMADSDAAGAALDQATDRANDSIGHLEMLIAAAEDVDISTSENPEAEPEAEPAEAIIQFRARRSELEEDV
ncbi:MAG: hypothetical protein AAGF30_11005 [Pseudomonadota bacterium]